jgi:hypothetical protein
MTIWGQAQPTIGHLSVRYRGTATDMNAPALRLRVERLLGSVDLHPAGLPAGAVLIVRRLHGLAPLSAQSQILPSDWTAHLRDQMRTLYTTAVRPALGPVAANANSVLFTDAAEMLACLTRDVLAGRAWQHWYWQQILRGVPQAPGPALTVLWSTQASVVPESMAIRRLEALAGIALLSTTEVNTVTHALHASFDLPSLVLTTRILALPLEASAAAFDSSLASEPRDASPIVPPWQPWLPASTLPTLTPQAHYLLGLALTLHHAPAFARSTRFAEQAAAWLSAELTALTHKRDQLLTRQPEPIHTTELSSSTQELPHLPSAVLDSTTLPIAPAMPGNVLDSTTLSTAPAMPGNVLDSTTLSIAPAVPMEPVEAITSAPPVANQPASAPTHEVLFGVPQGPPSDGLPTELGGVLYLINLLTWLDLLGCWDDDGTLAEHVGGWGIIEALARGLLGATHDRYVDDPLWSVLAHLDKREPDIPVGATLPQQAAFRLPAQWLRRYGPTEPVWVALLVDDARLLLFDENAGYLIADVPLLGRPPDEAIVAEIGAYQAQGVSDIIWHIMTESVDGAIPTGANVRGVEAMCKLPGIPVPQTGCPQGDAKTYQPNEPSPLPGNLTKNLPLKGLEAGTWLSPPTIWWLERILGFIQHLLARALGDPSLDTQQLAEILFYKHGQLLISRTHIDLHMSMDQISLPIRRAGLDRDPGWMPDLARIVLFHFN